MSDMTIAMTSSRPYLVRALNEWILDNDCTPYIVVDAGIQGVQVPTEHVANGQIVLNISPGAVRGLVIGNGALEFSVSVVCRCRFSYRCKRLWPSMPRRTARAWCLAVSQALPIRRVEVSPSRHGERKTARMAGQP